MEPKILDFLLKQKEECQKLIDHAIQHEKNPFADDGTLRLEQYRTEMQRINKELGITKQIIK